MCGCLCMHAQALNDIYERTERALAVAQANLERCKGRAERLHGLTACALLAALPLWWQPLPPLRLHQLSAMAAAGRPLGKAVAAAGGGGEHEQGGGAGQPAARLVSSQSSQTARVAAAVLASARVLLTSVSASLYVSRPPGGSSSSSSADEEDRPCLHVYEPTRDDDDDDQDKHGGAAAARGGVSLRVLARPSGHGKAGGLLGRCLRKGQLLNLARPQDEPRFNPKLDGQQQQRGGEEGAGSRPTLLVPLKCPGSSSKGGGGGPLGVLKVGGSEGGHVPRRQLEQH